MAEATERVVTPAVDLSGFATCARVVVVATVEDARDLQRSHRSRRAGPALVAQLTLRVVAPAAHAAAREQQELLERADDLRRQQETTEALLRKQERYLQVLEQQLKQLKEASDEEPAS